MAPASGPPETDLADPVQAASRCSRSVQTTIGWIFWDPGAVARYEALGLPGPIGYIAARSAPLAPAGPDAVIAAFGSISPAAMGLTGVEASILHNAWLGYEPGWLPRSRGSDEAEIAAGLASLEAKGLATGGTVTAEGVALRQRIEDDTDRLTTLPWELLGPEGCRRFAEELEPPCELLLHRVDVTAGPNYQPASRIRS